MAYDETKPGKFYEHTPDGLREVPAGDVPAPDVWICRRVADYPLGLPSRASIDLCRRCSAPIAYNPRPDVHAPRVCMQCAGIKPLPFGD